MLVRRRAPLPSSLSNVSGRLSPAGIAGLWASQTGLAVAFVAVSLFFLPFVFSQEPRWSLIYIIAGVSLFFIRELPKPAYIGLLFIAWCALSLAWSPDPREGLVGLSSMVALWAVFVLFWKHGTLEVLFWGAMIAVPGAIAMDFLLPGQEAGFGNQNWTSEWLLLCLPFLLLRWYGLPTAVAAAVYLAWFNPSYIEIAVLAGLIFVICIYHRLWVFVGLIVAAFGALLYVGPDFLGPDLLSSFKSRIEIFLNTTFLWAESPIIGHGLGSLNYEYGRVQEMHLNLFPGWGTQMFPITVYVGATHNEILQGLTEIGLVGVSLAAWLLWSLRRHPLSPAAGTLIIAGVLCLVAFPLQTPSSAFVIAAALGITAQGSPAVSWASLYSQWSGPLLRLIGSSLKSSSSWRRMLSGRYRPISTRTTHSRWRPNIGDNSY